MSRKSCALVLPLEVTGILSPYSALRVATNTSDANDIYAKAISQCLTGFFASSLSTNLLGTGKHMSA